MRKKGKTLKKTASGTENIKPRNYLELTWKGFQGEKSPSSISIIDPPEMENGTEKGGTSKMGII